MQTMRFVFMLLVGLGCVSMISSQQCYSCFSDLLPACGDPFNANAINATARENLPPGGVCMKLKQRDTSNSGRVIRMATADTSLCLGGINSCKEATQEGITGTICCCTGNLCNDMSTLQQQLFIIVLLTIITFTMSIYGYL